MQTNRERRSFERVPFFTGVALSPQIGGPAFETRAVNISVGGVGLVCHEPLPTGLVVILTFRLPTGTGTLAEERVVGRVAHVRFEEDAWVIGVDFAEPLCRDSAPWLARAIEKL